MVLREWLEALQIERADAVGAVAVLDHDPILFNQQLGDEGVAVIPVRQRIGNDLAQDFVSCADVHDPIQNEQIIQVLLSELEHPLI